jgi:hypothetical protein
MTRARAAAIRWPLRVALAAALVAGALGLYRARARLIAAFFVRGPGGAPAPRLPDAAGGGLAPTDRVRVVLVDGLARGDAGGLPALSRLCARGLDLVVDVGFPTVSLPVQSVLWTGLTQQQSGIAFVGARIAPPLAGIPARIPGSIALAESHAFIVESLGFAETRPRPEEIATSAARAAWEQGGFAAAARAAVSSAARLAFVHVLRVDDAGHRHGRRSPEYAAAAAWSDDLLADLFGAAPGATWLVLADHGHLAGGGHGGGEEEVRLVRACLSTAPEPGWAAGRAVHLVDLARTLADLCGVALPAQAAGRPLAAALARPAPRATLPAPGRTRFAIAAGLFALGLGATLVAARGRVGLLPWWSAVAYAALVASEGLPSLSRRMVFAPLGRDVALAALPGLVVLAIVAGLTTARAPVRLVVSQLALPAAALAACVTLAWGTPPLVPLWSAHASVGFVLCLSASLVVALALLAALVPGWFDRDRGVGSGRGAP